MTRKFLKTFGGILLFAVVVAVILFPIYQTLILSLRPLVDIKAYVGSIDDTAVRFVKSYLLPAQFSGEQYAGAFTADFLRAFGNSLLYAGAVTALQFPIALCMGLCFAKTRFKGRDALFFIYIAAMVMPFHVTLVPLFTLFKAVRLYDTRWAIILPGIFSPLGAFLFRQFISQVPDETLEAAQLDGAGMLRTVCSIILPVIKAGVAMYVLLTMVMQWSAVGPALSFLKSAGNQPLSLVLRQMMSNEPWAIFAPSVMYMLPLLVVFGDTVMTTRREGYVQSIGDL